MSESPDLAVDGIRAGRLEYREGSIWGNPYVRVLRSQLEKYIAEKLGRDGLASRKNETELRNVRREIAALRKKLAELEARKLELEKCAPDAKASSTNRGRVKTARGKR